MKQYAFAFAAVAALAGCSSPSGDVATTPTKPGEGQPLNPSGKQTPEEQAMADKMKAAGQARGQAEAEASRKMAEAMKQGKP